MGLEGIEQEEGLIVGDVPADPFDLLVAGPLSLERWFDRKLPKSQ